MGCQGRLAECVKTEQIIVQKSRPFNTTCQKGLRGPGAKGPPLRELGHLGRATRWGRLGPSIRPRRNPTLLGWLLGLSFQDHAYDKEMY